MELLLVAALSVLGTEAFMCLPIMPATGKVIASGSRASRVLLAKRASDHWKERAVGAYALRMGQEALVLTALFALLAGAMAVLLEAAEQLLPGTGEAFTTLPGLALGFAVSLGWYLIRSRHARP